MNDFDERWQTVVGRARQTPSRDPQAPFGFAARVVARGWQPQVLGLEEVWARLALRSLAGALGVLLVCAVLELPHFRDPCPLEPGLENTVARLVWTL